MFQTENTRLLSVVLLNLLFLLCGRMLPRWWGVVRAATGTLTYHWALCPRCAETPPLVLLTRLGLAHLSPLRTRCH